VYAPAVEAFLGGRPVPAPFVAAPAGAYRALCLPLPGREEREVVLLAGDDGAVYVPDHPDHPARSADGAAAPRAHEGDADVPGLEAALRRLRLRPSSTSLALRLPAGLAAPGTGGRVARFTLWASPAYQATAGSGSPVWK
jgi:hypothetical protein